MITYTDRDRERIRIAGMEIKADELMRQAYTATRLLAGEIVLSTAAIPPPERWVRLDDGSDCVVRGESE